MRPPGELLPRDVVDHMIRDSLRHPANLAECLELLTPKLAGGFDCARARPVERELMTEYWRSREVDLMFEVPYRSATGDRWPLVVLLIEHQTNTDPLVPLRCLFFIVNYWVEQVEEWKRLPTPRPRLRLRPVLPLVLAYAMRQWPAVSRDELIRVVGEASPTHLGEVKIVAQTIAEELIGEGKREGKVEEAQELLIALLESRFGTLPEALSTQIGAMTDLERVRGVFRQALKIQKLDDLHW